LVYSEEDTLEYRDLLAVTVYVYKVT
jgi:hypothetical protein